jgi:hypothetical protein
MDAAMDRAVIWVFIFWAAIISATAAGSDDLVLRIERAGSGFILSATTGGTSEQVSVDASTGSRLMSVRFSLECMVFAKTGDDCNVENPGLLESERALFADEQLSAILVEDGARLLNAFAPAIRAATQIRIEIPADLVKLPIDALYLDGQPLFLHKPIIYSIDRDRAPSAWTIRRSSRGLLISDPSTDPQRAVFSVAELFPLSARLNAKDVDPSTLVAHAPIEFLVISAHGSVGYGTEDHMELPNNVVLSPRSITNLRPHLVYLDSCNLGISMIYLEALRESGVQYFLAPMMSNEAGYSSTLTIKSFFSELAAGASPAEALYRTRRELYSAYEKDPFHDRLWRAFPFRVYSLN